MKQPNKKSPAAAELIPTQHCPADIDPEHTCAKIVKRAAAQDEQAIEQQPKSIQSIVHQLQVHQAELEMQNEELRRTQWQLETARLRYFELYDLAPVGYCTVSEQGIILEANLMAARLLGWDRAALVNQPISRFILNSHQDIYYLKQKQLVDSGEPQSWELCMVNQAGEPCWTHLAASFEKDSDGIAVQRMVMTDISERKRVEQTLRETEERYHKEQQRLDQILQDKNISLQLATNIAKKATSIAEKANLAKSDFLSGMSHELRTPLNAILGFAQLMESGTPVPTSDQQRHLDQILKAGWYLLELINEILDLALIESGKMSILLESLSLADLIYDCQTMIEPQAEKRHIQINFPSLETSYWVQADRTRLKQILINLLSNAIKYNKVGGTVTVHCVAQPLGRIRLCVEDTGEGLTPEKIAQLFQPFNRLGQEHNGEEGTGIGLVMAKRLIELMGGEIGLDSIPGTGSTFWIEMHMTEQPQISIE